MSSVKAVAISATQSGTYLDITASLGDYKDDKRYSIRLRWEPECPTRVDVASTEWLYNVLCSLIENFDDHDVVDVKVEGVDLMREVAKDA